jgi:lactate permease
MWFLSVLPIVILLLLMVKFKWGAVKAAPVGFVIAALSGFFFYQAPITLIALEGLKGLWNAFTVLIVIWPAILIYEVTNEAKAFSAFREGMQKFSGNELLQVLAIGWTFVSFLQGITGFGVPVAVGAPLLVGMGVRPLWAVTITLLGHAWANTFGTLAVAWEALVIQTNLETSSLFFPTALWAASILWLFNFLTGILICWWYGKKEAVKKGFLAVLFISIIHGGGELILTQFNPTLSAFLPASVALGIIFILGKLQTYHDEWQISESQVMDRKVTVSQTTYYGNKMTINQAFFPYYCLIFITLVILLVGPINRYFGQYQIGFTFPETRTLYGYVNKASLYYSPIKPFTHAGMFLLLSAFLGFIYFYYHGKLAISSAKTILWRTLKKTLPSSVGIVALVVMSKILGGTGQVTVLAMGTAKLTGEYYAALAAFIGILGSFITSSNLASNILFGGFQQTTANLLNLNEASILGAQTAGGAMGNTISPGNVLLGTTTTGNLGREGVVLGMILPITLSIAMGIGVLLLVANIF